MPVKVVRDDDGLDQDGDREDRQKQIDSADLDLRGEGKERIQNESQI